MKNEPQMRNGRTPGFTRKRLWSNEEGQGLSEYLILVLLVAVVSIAAARTLGATVKKKIQLAERHLEKVSVE